jgi:hypothetical protein
MITNSFLLADEPIDPVDKAHTVSTTGRLPVRTYRYKENHVVLNDDCGGEAAVIIWGWRRKQWTFRQPEKQLDRKDFPYQLQQINIGIIVGLVVQSG